jgi:signal transduction histidine kinase
MKNMVSTFLQRFAPNTLTRQVTLATTAVALVAALVGWAAGPVGGVLIAPVIALLGGLFVRSRVRPLWALTASARRMGAGDLDTPIHQPSSLLDVATLATILERARQRIVQERDEDARRRTIQAYFLANVSHEFRTPLAGMKVSLELLIENARSLDRHETDELLRSLMTSASSLQSLIDNLLESSKIEAGHFSLRRGWAALAGPLASALRVMQPLMARRAQTLTLDVPLMLPVLNMDETRVAQVILNLLGNASKYSPMGTPIDLCVMEADSVVRVEVSDCGAGLPPERAASAFRPFTRLGEGEAEDYGAGLGLAVVKAVVEAHGGQVGYHPRPSGGSTFWFTLPMQGEK